MEKESRGRQIGLKFSERETEALARISERWHASKTDVLACGVRLLADPELAAVLGGQFQSAEQALRCWAAVVVQASADNDRKFGRAEWNLIADANNGCSPMMLMAGEDVRVQRATTFLWANVEDSMRLDAAAEKWGVKDPRKLVERMRGLDFAHGWAMALAVQWFWEHCACTVDHEKDSWWTAAYRKSHRCGAE